MPKKDLVEIIKENPGCVAIVDNDSWRLYKTSPHTAPEENWNNWYKENLLATDRDILPLGDGGYGSGCCYGGDLLQALAAIVGITVESV